MSQVCRTLGEGSAVKPGAELDTPGAALAGKDGEMIFLLVAAAVIVAAPLVAAVLVTVASLREDSARSLTGRAPGMLTATARRLLCLRTSAGTSRSPSAGQPPADPFFVSRAYSEIPPPRSDEADQTLTIPRS
jgi:hypothetical protein